jgi:ATP-dependent DNA helicase RecG
MPSDPPQVLLTPESPLGEIGELPGRSLAMLAKAGFKVVADLLQYYPRRYENRRQFAGFPLEETAEAVCLHGIVTDCRTRRMGYRSHVEVVIEDASKRPLAGPILCRWFHMPWMVKSFAAGQEVVVYGRVKSHGKGRAKGLVLDHPDFEIIDPLEDRASLHFDRVVPVYPLGDGLSQKRLREAIHAVLERLDDESLPALLPEGAAPKTGRVSHRAAAMRLIHFPDSLEEAAAARQWLALEEFFLMQLTVMRRRQLTDSQPGVVHRAPGRLLDQWLDSLPFPLTQAQRRSIAEIRRDLAASRPMNRLLQGDVGSGKTFVALAAALLAAESGHQTAIMAPTQILAEQHFLTFQRHLAPLGVQVGLHTAAHPANRGGKQPVPAPQAQIIIGTHALLFNTAASLRPGLVIIDEQHKFGVAQRLRLAARGTAPDVLVMTATPIPRTLALTLYGDLDVSLLDELPAGRGRITTAVRQNVDLAQVAAFIRQQLEKGHQGYLVYPLVEESEAVAAKAATTEHLAWQSRLPGVEIGLLHGRLKPEAKEAVMNDFRGGRTRLLVSTSVVEVGVDVPNASLILVFNAERFGLAQLHQLRGRVGRGSHHSYCVLVCSDSAEGALERLQVLERTSDGFAIAEADLTSRGPGELLGQKQSGLPGLRLGDLAADAPLVHHARALAKAVLRADPELSSTPNQAARRLIAHAEPQAAAN